MRNKKVGSECTVSKNEVMRCSRFGNRGRMHVILSCQWLEEIDCIKYLGSQVAADGGYEKDVVQRMNEMKDIESGER